MLVTDIEVINSSVSTVLMFQRLADVLSQSCKPESKVQPSVEQIKASIWALVSVLVTPNGSRWERATTVLKDIFWLIAKADSLSIRGQVRLPFFCILTSLP